MISSFIESLTFAEHRKQYKFY